MKYVDLVGRYTRKATSAIDVSAVRHEILKEMKKIIHGSIIDEKEGWIIAHIFGDSYERGFAHGYLLNAELKKVINVLPFIVKEELHISFKKYIEKSNRIIKPKIKKQTINR